MIAREVDPSDFAALAALFERDHSPCYCRYWHFQGTNKEWEARCGLEPEENKKELERSLAIGETRGIVALDGDAIVGWMKVSRRGWVPKLLARSPYKNLDVPEDGDVFSIGCFLVDPACRRRGVARAMLARRRGAHSEARTLVREARRLLADCRDAGIVGELLRRTERALQLTPSRPETRLAVDAELSERELTILRLLASDLSQREIGSELYISLNTVKGHTRSIFRKLGVSSRADAVARGRELALF